MMASEPGMAVQRGILERIRGWLDRLPGSHRFRLWAARFPLTRPIARRRARALFDLMAGFVYSQVLLACVRLRVFEILAEGPQTLPALAPRLGLGLESTTRLLDAAVALRLLSLRGGQRYALGPLGGALVGNQALLAMIEHHAMLYADLADPVALLEQGEGRGQLARFWPYADAAQPGLSREAGVARYSALMSDSQPLVADEILDAYPFAQRHCLLDVGGGEGTFLLAVAQRAPALCLQLFDLPPVAERARARFAAAGLASRATAFGGSFLSDALPQGADVVSLVRVLHDHDDAAAMAILRAIRRIIPAYGELVIAEPMAGTPGAEAMGDAYFGFYLLAMGRGRARTPERLGQLLLAAGFDSGRLVATRLPIQTRLLVARPRTADA